MAKRLINFVLTKKPKPAHIQLAGFRAENRIAMVRIAEAHLKSRREAVADWSEKTRPEFSAKIQVTLALLSLEILAHEKNKKKPIWRWVDKTGVKAHKIRPRPENRSGKLFFLWAGPGSYQAHTGANPARFGGPGEVQGGKMTAAVEVDSPGFPARHITDKINDDLEPKAKNELYNAGRRALRRSKQ